MYSCCKSQGSVWLENGNANVMGNKTHCNLNQCNKIQTLFGYCFVTELKTELYSHRKHRRHPWQPRRCSGTRAWGLAASGQPFLWPCGTTSSPTARKRWHRAPAGLPRRRYLVPASSDHLVSVGGGAAAPRRGLLPHARQLKLRLPGPRHLNGDLVIRLFRRVS